MRYEILKDFPGSQDGRFTEQFVAGTQCELSDYLAAIVVPAGWARPLREGAALSLDDAREKNAIHNKAVVSDGSQSGFMKRNKK